MIEGNRYHKNTNIDQKNTSNRSTTAQAATSTIRCVGAGAEVAVM